MKDHVLADELRAYIDRARMHFLIDGMLAPAGPITEDNVAISANDVITLPAGNVDNMVAIGALLQRMLQFHEHVEMGWQLASDLMHLGLTAEQAREKLAALGWKGTVPPWSPSFVPADAKERDLMIARDDATRQVYADWLEEHGFEGRASFLRAELAGTPEPAIAKPIDLLWRKTVSRARIVGCQQPACPGRWDLLRGDDSTRGCGECGRDITYCIAAQEIHDRGIRGLPAAVDARIPFAEASATFINARLGPPMPMPPGNPPVPTWNPPPPQPPIAPTPPEIVPMPTQNPPPLGWKPREEKDGVLARFFGWFKKK